MIKSILILFLLLLLFPLLAVAQNDESDVVRVRVPREEQDIENRLSLAKSNTDYPATPGDVYSLAYRYAGKEVSEDVMIESDYTLDLNIFGKLDVEGMTFPELKRKIEETISKAYPNSVPFTVIKSVGMFQVLIKGEVAGSQFVSAWGLTRLSEVIADRLSPYSSIRNVMIISKAGVRRTYDIYKAVQLGFLEENPFVRPGDTILLQRRGRQIEITGAVFHAGVYQILPRDNLLSVLESYGGGLTELADRSRIKVERNSGDKPQSFTVCLIVGKPDQVSLEDNDTIIVPSKLANLPVVFFEGALISDQSGLETGMSEIKGAVTEEFSRIAHPFRSGDTLYDAISSLGELISPLADLKNSYIIREDRTEPIPVDLEKLYYRYQAGDDIVLKPFDRIVIPRYRYFVTVVGAVESPGNFPYSPERRYDYYVGLAGGIPSGIDSDNISIFDKNGNKRVLNDSLNPEDMVIVAESFVSVTGAVIDPGPVSYTPGKRYTYYIDMAGGIDTEKNTDSKVEITDARGNPRGKNDFIQPNDRIFVEMNDFIYHFNRYFPVITTGMVFITTIITIIDLLSN